MGVMEDPWGDVAEDKDKDMKRTVTKGLAEYDFELVSAGYAEKFIALAEPHPACCRNLEQQCSKRDRRDPSSPCSDPTRPRRGADTYFDSGACACTAGENTSAISPLYPNPWRKKCWGPFTAFRTDGLPTAAQLFRKTKRWPHPRPDT